ncbi:MAG: hypothetical protein QW610_07380 [Pyrobaculum sp.]
MQRLCINRWPLYRFEEFISEGALPCGEIWQAAKWKAVGYIHSQTACGPTPSDAAC